MQELYLMWPFDPSLGTGVWSKWKVNLLEQKCPALKTFMFCQQGLTLKNEWMTLLKNVWPEAYSGLQTY